MSSLRRRYKNFKKAKTNPYAGRGLDKFALVSAELEAKREKLAAELGTPLSMVKFAIGSHNKWIPIILSRSIKKENHAPKKQSGASVNEEKLASSSRVQKSCLRKGGRTPLGGLIKEEEPQLSSLISEDQAHGRVFAKDEVQTHPPPSFRTTNAAHVAGDVDGQKPQLSGSINENPVLVSRSIGEDAFLRDNLQKEDISHTDSVFNEDGLYVDVLVQKKISSLGSLIGIKREDSGEIIETFSDSSGAENITTYEEDAVVLQGGNLKNVIGVITGIPWVVSKASTIASSIIFLKGHAKSIASGGKTSLPERESLRTADDFHAATISVSLSTPPLDKALVSSQVLPLPSPPTPLKIPNVPAVTSGQAEIFETTEDVGTPQLQTATKQVKKCKVKGLLKMRSAPSTPRDSRKPNKSFAAASTLVNDQAADADMKEQQLLAPRNPHSVPRRSRLSKVSNAADLRKERARRAGHALAAAGIALSLSGLAMGYVSAVIGVVCWWYVLPSLRKAVGDRPMVRSHHSHVNKNTSSKALNARAKGTKITKEVARDKYDLQSQEYKKKVIMDGLLDRRRRSDA